MLIVLFLFFPAQRSAGQDKVFTVVIDPGHGGKDPGAVGATAKEKDINLAVSLKLGKLIGDSYGDVKVVYTRDRDRFIDLNERANIANKYKADLFISIHTNAVAKGSVRGTETYTLGLARTEENLRVAMMENSAILLEDDYMQKYEGFDPKSSESYIIFEFMQNKHMEQSISFASEIQKGFVACKRVDRGVRQAGFLVLRKTSMPSVLIELGYISTPAEEQYMKSAQGQNQLAKAIYDAFVKYKREYDRKQGGLPADAATSRKEITETPSTAHAGQVVYKVQIVASNKKLASNAKELKGYKNVDFYVENGMYKYTYGESTSMEEIRTIRRNLIKDFKDAFIISFKDGKKVK
ncbi:N-acetylmuramoyl-L-alanine amidase [Parabacteroides sp. PFB2-10]|uniref:N-acetylmuramoyl-L-alanine amidase family protein n=1 Tax=Parabacteroides sp. PFB2-10 TaxID=1742405 RepID=UPI002475F3B3|nr:N-acetylmuramoyl-L-alanine amidase [Parabacteroides sp. PFB2-10]